MVSPFKQRSRQIRPSHHSYTSPASHAYFTRTELHSSVANYCLFMSSTKRKSDASTSASAKKARLVHAATAERVKSILDHFTDFPIPDGPDNVRRTLIELATYARGLEEEVLASKPKEKTPEDLQAAAAKLRTAARSGIRKQMTVMYTIPFC